MFQVFHRIKMLIYLLITLVLLLFFMIFWFKLQEYYSFQNAGEQVRETQSLVESVQDLREDLQGISYELRLKNRQDCQALRGLNAEECESL